MPSHQCRTCKNCPDYNPQDKQIHGSFPKYCPKAKRVITWWEVCEFYEP